MNVGAAAARHGVGGGLAAHGNFAGGGSYFQCTLHVSVALDVNGTACCIHCSCTLGRGENILASIASRGLAQVNSCAIGLNQNGIVSIGCAISGQTAAHGNYAAYSSRLQRNARSCTCIASVAKSTTVGFQVDGFAGLNVTSDAESIAAGSRFTRKGLDRNVAVGAGKNRISIVVGGQRNSIQGLYQSVARCTIGIHGAVNIDAPGAAGNAGAAAGDVIASLVAGANGDIAAGSSYCQSSADVCIALDAGSCCAGAYRCVAAGSGENIVNFSGGGLGQSNGITGTACGLNGDLIRRCIASGLQVTGDSNGTAGCRALHRGARCGRNSTVDFNVPAGGSDSGRAVGTGKVVGSVSANSNLALRRNYFQSTYCTGIPLDADSTGVVARYFNRSIACTVDDLAIINVSILIQGDGAAFRRNLQINDTRVSISCRSLQTTVDGNNTTGGSYLRAVGGFGQAVDFDGTRGGMNIGSTAGHGVEIGRTAYRKFAGSGNYFQCTANGDVALDAGGCRAGANGCIAAGGGENVGVPTGGFVQGDGVTGTACGLNGDLIRCFTASGLQVTGYSNGTSCGRGNAQGSTGRSIASDIDIAVCGANGYSAAGRGHAANFALCCASHGDVAVLGIICSAGSSGDGGLTSTGRQAAFQIYVTLGGTQSSCTSTGNGAGYGHVAAVGIVGCTIRNPRTYSANYSVTAAGSHAANESGIAFGRAQFCSLGCTDAAAQYIYITRSRCPYISIALAVYSSCCQVCIPQGNIAFGSLHRYIAAGIALYRARNFDVGIGFGIAGLYRGPCAGSNIAVNGDAAIARANLCGSTSRHIGRSICFTNGDCTGSIRYADGTLRGAYSPVNFNRTVIRADGSIPIITSALYRARNFDVGVRSGVVGGNRGSRAGFYVAIHGDTAIGGGNPCGGCAFNGNSIAAVFAQGDCAGGRTNFNRAFGRADAAVYSNISGCRSFDRYIVSIGRTVAGNTTMNGNSTVGGPDSNSFSCRNIGSSLIRTNGNCTTSGIHSDRCSCFNRTNVIDIACRVLRNRPSCCFDSGTVGNAGHSILINTSGLHSARIEQGSFCVLR